MSDDPPPSAPDLRDFEFRAQRERAEALKEDQGSGITVDPATGEYRLSSRLAGQVMAWHRVHWLLMVTVQIPVVLIATGWVLFTQYSPAMDISPPMFTGCLLMIAGSSISTGICGFASFRPEELDRSEAVATSYIARFFPLAGLLSWAACLWLFWRFLHGWDPGRAAFFVTNPYGQLILAWLFMFLALWFVITPLLSVAMALRRQLQANGWIRP